MSSPRTVCTVAALAALLIALAAAMPAPDRPDKLDVADVINKTVCPIKIRIDEDKERVPPRIRVMECEATTNTWCSKNSIPPHECCHHRHADVVLQCVEIQDHVQVYFPKTNETQQIRVSVGCTCMMRKSGVVDESRPGR